MSLGTLRDTQAVYVPASTSPLTPALIVSVSTRHLLWDASETPEIQQGQDQIQDLKFPPSGSPPLCL